MFAFGKIKIVTFVVFFCVIINKTKGSCNFNVEIGLKRPLLTQKFGSKTLKLSTRKSPIVLEHHERIEAFCGSGFRTFRTYNVDNFNKGQKVQTLNFLCYNDHIYVYEIEVGNDYLYNNPTIACRGAAYSIFESKETLLNCENSMSYLLGAKTDTPIILAGLCYDLDRLHLNYVDYKLQDQYAVLEKNTELYPLGTNVDSLLEPLHNVERFIELPSNEDIKEDIETQSSSNFWLIAAEYERSSIIQTNNYYSRDLNDHSCFFDIIWWRPLRMRNWNRFVKLLEKRAEVVNYIIYSGTSGAADIPRESNFLQKFNLEINYQGGKKIVPQFIWTYLESTDDNIPEDFVVIAYNSPYFEYFPKNSSVICNDMCDEIEWMQEMKDSRYISTLGVLYCCRPEEIIGHLDGFPKTFNDTLMTNEIMVTTITP